MRRGGPSREARFETSCARVRIIRRRALTLLEHDPLRHIVGLKMLERAGATADVRVREDATGWAVLIGFDASAFEYDAQTYGRDARIAVLEGTSDRLQIDLLADLPRGRDVILKTQTASVVRSALERFAPSRSPALLLHPEAANGDEPHQVATFLSFTTGSGPSARDDAVISGSALSPELEAFFEGNGYGPAELARHFADGARWFAIEHEGTLAAACFVFRNYGPVWEIAGVHTASNARRQGLAARVVCAALSHLLAAGALPRYQTSAANEASVALARSLGLAEFLRIEHVRIPRVRT